MKFHTSLYSFLLVIFHTMTPSLAKKKNIFLHRTVNEVEDGDPNVITHGKANLGETCFHNCDCYGFPDVRCEKRAFGQKRCYSVCKQIGVACSVKSDCCSQTCRTGKCCNAMTILD